jgi:hypothetical protein
MSLLVRLLATAADSANQAGHPVLLRDFESRWTALETIGSIAAFAEPAFASPDLAGLPGVDSAQAAVLAVVAEAVQYEPAYRWLEQVLHSDGVSVEDTVHRFRDLVWPKPYACAVARFHHNVDDYRWADTESFPVPHNPYKLPEAELANFRRAAAASSSLGERVLALVGSDRFLLKRKDQRVKQWRSDLRSAGLPGWTYLDTEWAVVLDAAKGILNSTRPWSRAGARVAVEQLEQELRGPVWSLFEDPISWAPDQQSVSNGQHRGLAMFMQRVPAILVAVP